MILQIAAPHVEQMWESFAWQLLVPAMKKFWWDVTPEQVKAQLMAGTMQLWIVPDRAALVTRIDQYPHKRMCTVLLAGGKHAREWIREAADVTSEFARQQGCHEIRILARRGWLHYLKQDVTELGAIFAKRLNHAE